VSSRRSARNSNLSDLILQKPDLQKLVLLPVAMMLFLWAASASSGLVLRANPELAAATR
jgi:hypothetical protein